MRKNKFYPFIVLGVVSSVAFAAERQIDSRLSAQQDIPAPEEIIDGTFIVVGSGKRKTRLVRDDVNTHKGFPVYRFSADGDANRIELSTCFGTKENLKGVSPEKIDNLKKMKDVYINSDQGNYGDTVTYDWYARFPEKLTKDSAGIFAQWHGRPDRTLIRDPEGQLEYMPLDQCVKLLDTMEFDHNIGIDKKTGEPNGWQVDQAAGGPVAAFKISSGYMLLLVRSDPNRLSNPDIKIKPKPGRQPGKTFAKGNKTATHVFERPVSQLPVNQWMHFKVRFNYSTYDRTRDRALAPGRAEVWIDGAKVADWTGNIGKNDERGPYFKFGIYKPGENGFKVDCCGFAQHVERNKEQPELIDEN